MRRLIWIAGLLTAFVAGNATAASVEGVDIPDTANVGGQELVLNGTGVRTKFFFDIYIGALYLTAKTSDAEKAINDAGPKRVLMHFLYSEVEREKLVEAWDEGFEDNLSQSRRAALDERINQFTSYFNTVHEGDRVTLDYVPDEGTKVLFNGELKGTVGGADFQRAWLRVFLGRSPADSGLKAGMLGTD
jgi:hypothetical protein